MNSIWQTLDVPRGSDRDAIRRGYARKLKTVHPEDDPQGFQDLREAYERALQEAEWGYYEEDEEEEAYDEEDEAAFEPAGFATARFDPEPPLRADDPDRTAEDEREHAELDLRMRDFARLLDPDAEADPQHLTAAFDAIVASPLMGSISARSGIEAWLAAAIAETIPRSDPLIPHAIETFGWNANDHLRMQDWHLVRIMRRIDEWNFVNTADTPGTDLHTGWRALTGPPLPSWRMRLLGWSTTRRAQAARILERARYDMPGLHHHFTPERAQWWEAFGARAHHTAGTLLLAPLVFLLVLAAAFSLSDDDAVVGAAILAGLPLALAAPTLWVRLVKRRQLAWMQGDAEPPSRWFATGWMAYAAALPLVAMLLPGNSVGIGIGFALSALLVLWTTTALPPTPPSGTLASRVGVLALRLWGPFIFWGSQSILEGPHRHIQTAVGLSVLVVWLRGRDEMLYTLQDLLPRLRVPATWWAIPALIGLALLVHAMLPATPFFYLAAMAVILGWPLLLLLAGSEPRVKTFVNVSMWIALFGFYLFAIPQLPDTPKQEASLKATSAICQLDTRTEPGPPLPCGSPASWFSADDYPDEALRNDAAGTTDYELYIDQTGAVLECTVIQSSGSSALDEMTCKVLRERGRFLPARDAFSTIAAPWANRTTWRLMD